MGSIVPYPPRLSAGRSPLIALSYGQHPVCGRIAIVGGGNRALGISCHNLRYRFKKYNIIRDGTWLRPLPGRILEEDESSLLWVEQSKADVTRSPFSPLPFHTSAVVNAVLPNRIDD